MKKTDTIKMIEDKDERIKNTKTLDELFVLWKEAQGKEENAQETFPCCPCCGKSPEFLGFKEFFYLDGYISDKDRYNGVLIICKESNATEDIRAEKCRQDFFWIKENKEKTGKYWSFINKALNELCKQEDKTDEHIKDPSFCAYVNINKRGGYGRCNLKQLSNYFDKYRLFIKKEIELLTPKYVICGGVYGTVKNILPDTVKKVMDCWHPSRGFKCKGIHDVIMNKEWFKNRQPKKYPKGS